jgi:hypothetical protein
MSLKSVPYVSMSTTLFNISATLRIVNNKICSQADVALDALAVELTESLKDIGAMNSVSALDTTPVCHRYSRERCSVPD